MPTWATQDSQANRGITLSVICTQVLLFQAFFQPPAHNAWFSLCRGKAIREQREEIHARGKEVRKQRRVMSAWQLLSDTQDYASMHLRGSGSCGIKLGIFSQAHISIQTRKFGDLIMLFLQVSIRNYQSKFSSPYSVL